MRTTSGPDYVPKQVTAWVLPGIKHLFVNEGVGKAGGGWVVSHYGSGFALNLPYVFKTKKDAIKAMAALAEIATWEIKDPHKLKKRNPILDVFCYEVALQEVGLKGFVGGDARMNSSVGKRRNKDDTKKKKKHTKKKKARA